MSDWSVLLHGIEPRDIVHDLFERGFIVRFAVLLRQGSGAASISVFDEIPQLGRPVRRIGRLEAALQLLIEKRRAPEIENGFVELIAPITRHQGHALCFLE